MSQLRINSQVQRLGIAFAVLLSAATSLRAHDPKSPASKGNDPAKTVGVEQAGKPATKGDPRVNIVLIGISRDTHAYATHMYLHECHVLATCLNQTPGVEAVVLQDWPDAKTLSEARAIVYYSGPAGDIVLDSKHRDAFRKQMMAGAGFVAIHWAVATKDKDLGAEYLNTLGGWYHTSHASQTVQTAELQQADIKHPICRGWKNYPLREEYYFNLKFHPQAQPLVRVAVTHPKVASKTQEVAWAFERPGSQGGRSFGTTLGHFHENFEIKSFRRMIVNGILWSAHVDIPAEGAPVSVSTSDLELPPPTALVIPKKK